MGSHSVTCHPAEVTFPPLLQPAKAGTLFSKPGGMQGWVSWPGWLGYIPRWYTRPKTITHPSTNRTQRRVTSFMRRMTPPLRQTACNVGRLTARCRCQLRVKTSVSLAAVSALKLCWRCLAITATVTPSKPASPSASSVTRTFYGLFVSLVKPEQDWPQIIWTVIRCSHGELGFALTVKRPSSRGCNQSQHT